MIALLIGGTVVLCIGVLTVVFGIPIKEFSFGNTMILAGAVVSCTGVVLMGLYFVGRELRNLTRRLDAGLFQAPSTQREAANVPRGRAADQYPLIQPKAVRPHVHAGGDDLLFSRDPLSELEILSNEISRPLPAANAPPLSAPWQEESPVRARPAEPRRDVMFSSKRRDQIFEDDTGHSLDGFPEPQRNGRGAPFTVRDDADAGRERFQPPRRGDAASVSIVKSGVVDSMAYSLYSDGSIEAQLPEGMVRFSSIDELRSHLGQRR